MECKLLQQCSKRGMECKLLQQCSSILISNTRKGRKGVLFFWFSEHLQYMHQRHGVGEVVGNCVLTHTHTQTDRHSHTKFSALVYLPYITSRYRGRWWMCAVSTAGRLNPARPSRLPASFTPGEWLLFSVYFWYLFYRQYIYTYIS